MAFFFCICGWHIALDFRIWIVIDENTFTMTSYKRNMLKIWFLILTTRTLKAFFLQSAAEHIYPRTSFGTCSAIWFLSQFIVSTFFCQLSQTFKKCLIVIGNASEINRFLVNILLIEFLAHHESWVIQNDLWNQVIKTMRIPVTEYSTNFTDLCSSFCKYRFTTLQDLLMG